VEVRNLRIHEDADDLCSVVEASRTSTALRVHQSRDDDLVGAVARVAILAQDLDLFGLGAGDQVVAQGSGWRR
jgi:hypothetical protein